MIAASALVALGFAALHVLAARLRFLDRVPRSRLLSMAGGTAVAYVFVHLLPELATAQAAVTEAVDGPLRLVERHVYVVALTGLVVFYALERHAVRSRVRARRQGGVDVTEAPVARVVIGSYAVYNALVGYLVTEQTDPRSLGATAVALAVHLVVVDHGLRDHHGAAYHRWGRWLCAAAPLLGWVVGTTVPVPEVVVAILLAFLAGGVVMNSIKEELPEHRDSRLGAFAAGAAGYAVLLLLG